MFTGFADVVMHFINEMDCMPLYFFFNNKNTLNIYSLHALGMESWNTALDAK